MRIKKLLKTLFVFIVVFFVSSAHASLNSQQTRKEIQTSKHLIYQELMQQALNAFDKKDHQKSLDLFYRAHLVAPEETRPIEYINLIKAQMDDRLCIIEQQTKAVEKALDTAEKKESRSLKKKQKISKPKRTKEKTQIKSKDKDSTRKTRRDSKKTKKTKEQPDILEASLVPEFLEEASVLPIQEELPIQALQAVPAEQDVDQSKDDAVNQLLEQEMSAQETVQIIDSSPPVSPLSVEGIPAETAAVESPREIRLPKKQKIIETIDLQTLVEGKMRPILTIPMWESVRIRLDGLKRLMVMDPEIASVTSEGSKEFLVQAHRRGTTFLHIWHDQGRITLYVEVLLPVQEDQIVYDQTFHQELSRPFRFEYMNDWSNYYKGWDHGHLKRQERANFSQTFSMDGETPWGMLDASQNRYGYGSQEDIGSYTIGLSEIPIPATKNFNIRIFDATRGLSPLTFSGTRLRGVFSDVDLFNHMLRISVGSGRQKSSYIFYIPGFAPSTSDHRKVDMLQVILFPKDPRNYLSFNFIRGYGRDYDDHYTRHAYSVEGKKQISKFLLNAELAHNDNQFASTGGFLWQDIHLSTGIQLRDINKDYTGVLTNPSGQGEVGATWTTNWSSPRLDFTSILDVYRDRLYFNPERPNTFNYDVDLHSYVALDQSRRWMLDSLLRYTDTAGEESPRTFLTFQHRLSKNFKFINMRDGIVFLGGGFQQARYEKTPFSEYDRYSVICGLQLPFGLGLSGYANYEYSWLEEPTTGLKTNPSVFNAGLNYSTNITQRLSTSCSIAYRNEQDVEGFNSFLAGEDSVSVGLGFSFTPWDDLNIFADGRMRKVMPEKETELDYYDLDLRLGMRMSWGSKISWNPAGKIAGFVFKDRNGDGKFDPMTEDGIANVTVKIGNTEVQTDEKGWYKHTVHAKRVIVLPTLDTLPKGFTFSTEPSFKIDIVQGMTRRVDFGLAPQSGIYGVVYVDMNENGQLDQEDKFISRIQVLLDSKTPALSDARGAYFFNNVQPGKHTISLNMKHVPMEYLPAIKMKNEIEVAEGATYVFHIPMKMNKVSELEETE